MTNKLYKSFLLILSVLVLTASCTKLDEKPTDTIDPSKAFRNIADINLGVIGVYAIIDMTDISVNSTVSDEAAYPTENNVGNSDAFRWLYNAGSGIADNYYTFYLGIDRANRVLDAINQLAFTGTDLATANRYKAELLALRAYFHFESLRLYASAYQTGALGLHYKKESSITYSARDSFESVVANCNADLAEAKGLMPTSFNDKTRVTRLAISAIQARLALYAKNWSDAITYANEVIAGAPLATKAQFPGIWTDANENEVIWKAKRVATDTRTGAFYYRESGGIVLYAPAMKLINTFDKVNDIRYPAYIRFDATRTGTKSQYLVNKYIGGSAANPGQADLKLFRTGEMYLIKAEAEAETTGDAAGDLNTLRAARINGYTNATFGSKPALIDAIMEERYKELAFEGHRFFDLRRRNLPVQRLAVDAANASGAVTLLPSQAQYALPLPAAEIQINKNTVQNPNY